MKKRVTSALVVVTLAILGTAVWTFTARAAYESAEYEVVESDGAFEVRDYPDLMLAATDSQPQAKGRDGSFMRLFGYISGANQAEQKIEMTTPVFMQGGDEEASGSMGFVLPKEVAAEGAPEPTGEKVKLRKRPGGRFAVVRFSGRLDATSARQQEAKLREWMKSQGLQAAGEVETAGYDPPFTPPPLRRNEILIRLQPVDEAPPGEESQNQTAAEQ
ncbi:SOUL family heme-binding protein [Roseimaritima ulvae]|uniref:SOUL heme-binding protein n=1 Tax=Roseimaritima ulvae TaxID=980254 RepID=A0A5B9QUP7_9BACT|nr:heme-binding protein [Roseimaritima ulvae]QEG41689.1 SOUL heme-binding protein [Roseimaritima ulvae]